MPKPLAEFKDTEEYFEYLVELEDHAELQRAWNRECDRWMYRYIPAMIGIVSIIYFLFDHSQF